MRHRKYLLLEPALSNRAPVLLAGFACGQGLTGMGSVAIALIARSVAQLPY